MLELIYYSRLAPPCSMKDLREIASLAAARNEAIGVTGYLTGGNGFFLQVLEGPPEAVTELFCKISRDPRHQRVTLIHAGPLAVRRFSRWSMGMCVLEKDEVGLLRFGPSAKLQADQLTVEAARELLLEVAERRRLKSAA